MKRNEKKSETKSKQECKKAVAGVRKNGSNEKLGKKTPTPTLAPTESTAGPSPERSFRATCEECGLKMKCVYRPDDIFKKKVARMVGFNCKKCGNEMVTTVYSNGTHLRLCD